MRVVSRNRPQMQGSLRKKLVDCTFTRNGEEVRTKTARAWEAYDETPEAVLFTLGPSVCQIHMPDGSLYELSHPTPELIVPFSYESSRWPCTHTPGQVAGYIVTYSKLGPRGGDHVVFEDIFHVEDPLKYAAAEAIRDTALKRVAEGKVSYTWAAIHPVYVCGHRIA